MDDADDDDDHCWNDPRLMSHNDDADDADGAIGDLLMSPRFLFFPHCLNARVADALNIFSTLSLG